MTQALKLRQRFLSQPKDFKWSELKVLLHSLGFLECNMGKTSGSRVRFVHEHYSDIILHKPHPKPELRAYQIKQIIEQLTKEGLL
jgi:predicted RNA binding protein YcfA (HicA-like mRNA interferase family)